MSIITKSLLCATALTVATAMSASNPFQRVGSRQLRFNRTAGSSQFVQPRGGQMLFKQQQKPSAFRAPMTAQAVPDLYGAVIYSAGLVTPTGLYSVDFADNYALNLVNADIFATQGGVLVGSTYYVIYQTLEDGAFVHDWVDTYDIRTWERLSHEEKGGDPLFAPGDLAADPTTNTIYGCFWNDNGTGYVFGKVDYDKVERTAISDVYAPWIGCAFDAAGQLYAVNDNGNLIKVDKRNGEFEEVGYTGIESMYPSSATIDLATNVMYCTAAPMDGRGLLYQVSLEDGTATLLCEFPNSEELVGLFIPVELDSEKPGPVRDLYANFPDGTLTGAIEFTAPTTMQTGDKGTGNLEYIVSVDEEDPITGPMTWGAEVSVPMTVTTGKHDFTVKARSGSKESTIQTVSLYVGNDTPQAPIVEVERTDAGNVLSWTLPLEGVNGGYVNPSEAMFTVTRLNDNTVLAEGIKGRSFTDPVEETSNIVTYNYSVVATFDGRNSEAGFSAPMSLGFIEPPYLQTFDTADALAGYTIIDHNDDTMMWKWLDDGGNGVVRMNYRNTVLMDDYLITPAVQLEGGKAYRLSFDVNSHKAGTTERIEVLLGEQPTVEAMTTTLVAPTEIPYTEQYQTKSAVIVPQATGKYYIAFHGISDPGQYYLKLDNIAISAAQSPELPAGVTNLTATPDYDGALKVHMQFDAPTKNVGGTGLNELTRIDVKRGDKVVKSFDNPKGKCEFDDEDFVESGRYAYTVTTYNSFGEGLSENVNVFVGINKPGVVSNLKIWEEEEGLAAISWDAPANDVDGQPMNPALVTYTIADVTTGEVIVIEEGITDTEYAYQAVAPGEQNFVSLAVFAVTEAGMSTGLSSKVIPVGTPFDLPYEESFANGLLYYPLALTFNDPSHKGQWQIVTDDADIQASDGDGGFIGMLGSAVDDEASIWTGKITLANAMTPQLTFQIFNMCIDETPNWNFVTVQVECDGKIDDLDMICPSDLGGTTQDWFMATVDLSKYAGKEIRLGLTACTQVYAWTFIDAITIADAQVGISSNTTDRQHETVYYDLIGRRIQTPGHGIFVARQGDKTMKVKM